MRGHVDPLAGEANAFQFQQPSLQQRSFPNGERIHQNFSSGADHTLPGQSLRAAVHCPAHLARHVGRSQQRGDLSVGQYFAARNRTNDGVNPFEELTIFDCRLPIAGTVRRRLSQLGSMFIGSRFTHGEAARRHAWKWGQSAVANRKSPIPSPFSPLEFPSQDIEEILVAGFDQFQSDG